MAVARRLNCWPSMGFRRTVESSNLSRLEALARIPDESQILPKVSEGPNRGLMHFSKWRIVAAFVPRARTSEKDVSRDTTVVRRCNRAIRAAPHEHGASHSKFDADDLKARPAIRTMIGVDVHLRSQIKGLAR
jgi:hypothetical protein